MADVRGGAIYVLITLYMVENCDGGVGPKDYCQNEKFSASCQRSEVISITTAMYGRMKQSRCVERDYGYVGCDMDVRKEADRLCSGRHQCEIGIPNAHFDAYSQCPTDLKSYFSVDYECVPVINIPAGRHTCSKSRFILLTSPSGNLASVVTKKTDLGSPTCPWLIQGKPGQTVSITLVDYSTSATNAGPCQEAYAVISEKTPPRTETVCSRTERERQVYISRSESVKVRITVNTRSEGTGSYFMLKYQIHGCPTPELPQHAEFAPNKDRTSADVICKNTGRKWHLECNGTRWIGQFDNCTGSGGGKVNEVSMGLASLPFGASLIVIVAIALALGILILVSGLVIIRCRRQSRLPPPPAPNVYQGAGKDVLGLHATYHPTARVEQDSLYQSSENEYAYIADFPPPGEGPNLSHRHPDSHPGRKCSDYGTANSTHAHSGGNKLTPAEVPDVRQISQKSCCDSGGPRVPRYVDKVDPSLIERGDPPAYFVLDPEEKKKKLEAMQKAGEGHHNGIGCIMNGEEHHNGVGCIMNGGVSPAMTEAPSAVMKRMNQSIHEFTSCACDHLVDTPENTNHKSV